MTEEAYLYLYTDGAGDFHYHGKAQHSHDGGSFKHEHLDGFLDQPAYYPHADKKEEDEDAVPHRLGL